MTRAIRHLLFFCMSVSALGLAIGCSQNSVKSENNLNSQNNYNFVPTAPECGNIGRLDTVTNLCWQSPRALGGEGVLDGSFSWVTAHEYCENLESGLYNNWRLPTAAEYAAVLGGCDGNVAGGESAACNDWFESERYKALFGNEVGIFMTDTPQGQYGYWYANSEMGFVDFRPDDPMFPDARTNDDYFHVRCVFQMY